MRRRIELSRNAVELLKASPEGSAVVDVAVENGKLLPAVYVHDPQVEREVKRAGKVTTKLNLYRIKEGPVVVVVGHLSLLPYALYEFVINPAERYSRQVLQAIRDSDEFLFVFTGGLLGRFPVLEQTKEVAERLLEEFEENQWTGEEFLKAKEEVFRKYSVEDLQRLQGELN